MRSKFSSNYTPVLTCLLVTVSMVTVVIATPVRVKYDQRQEGEYNFAAHIKKVAIMLPSDTKTQFDLSDLDFDDLKHSGLSQQAEGLSQQFMGLSQQGHSSQGEGQSGNDNMQLIASRNRVKWVCRVSINCWFNMVWNVLIIIRLSIK